MSVDLTQNLALEVQNAASDVFVLGRSFLGGAVLAGEADTPESGVEWLDILGVSNEVTVERGVKRNGLAYELQPGLMYATVYDPAIDPNVNPYIKPGTPIRLLHDTEPVFTGVIRNVKVTYRNKKVQVYLSAVDRTKDLANINRDGTTAAWYRDRVSTLLSKHGIPFTCVGTDETLTLAQNSHDSTLLNHMVLATTSERGRFFVDKGNVVRAAGPHAFGYGWNRGNIMDAPNMADDNNDGTVNRWGQYVKFTSTSPVFAVVDQKQTISAASIPVDGRLGVQVYIPVKKNQPYTFATDWAKSGTNTNLRFYIEARTGTSSSDAGEEIANYSAILTDASGRYVINLPGHETIGCYRILVWLEPTTGNSATTAYGEFSDVVFVEGTTDGSSMKGAVINFTDQQAVLGNDVEYTDIQVGYDSSAIANDVWVNNLTYDTDGEGNPLSVITKHGPYRNPTSVATYGAYTEEVETNLDPADVDAFAASLLNEAKQPEVKVDSIRFNATEIGSIAADLEVFDLVNVEYTNDAFHIGEDFEVLNIKHTITAGAFEHRWMVDIDLSNSGGTA